MGRPPRGVIGSWAGMNRTEKWFEILKYSHGKMT